MKQAEATQELSRKEREKRTHRQEILRAAGDLFARRGYHNTTLEEIARHAEFGKGTIYNYFANKDELFYGIIDQVLDEVENLAGEAVRMTAGGAREKLEVFARKIIFYSQKHSDLFRLIIQEMVRRDAEKRDRWVHHIRSRVQTTLGIIAGPLEEEIRTKRLRPFDPLQLAALISSTLHFYCMHLLSEPRKLSAAAIDDVAALVMTIYFDGLNQG